MPMFHMRKEISALTMQGLFSAQHNKQKLPNAFSSYSSDRKCHKMNRDKCLIHYLITRSPEVGMCGSLN